MKTLVACVPLLVCTSKPSARRLSLQAACINCLKVSALVYVLDASAAAQHCECDQLRHALSEPYRHVTLVGRCDGVMIVCGKNAPQETKIMEAGDSTQHIVRSASPKHSSFGAHARATSPVTHPPRPQPHSPSRLWPSSPRLHPILIRSFAPKMSPHLLSLSLRVYGEARLNSDGEQTISVM